MDAGLQSNLLYQLIHSLVRAIESRDQYTAQHQCTTSELARLLGYEIGLSAFEVEGVHVAGQLHDIGKIAIPSQLLTKVGTLTDQEFALIKTHVDHGVDILKGVDFPWPVTEIVGQHHERMDGSGYPNGLRNSEIHIGARILAVADTANAVVHARPYRRAMGLDALMAIFETEAQQFDGDVVAAFRRLLHNKGEQLFEESLAVK